MNTSMISSTPTWVLTSVLLAVASAAFADPAPSPPRSAPSLTVRFRDLNLSTPQGNRALYGRISSAATMVCGPSSISVWYAPQYWVWKACYDATMDGVVRKLNLPALTDLHSSIKQRAQGKPALRAGNQ
jgi:UrcA family protein